MATAGQFIVRDNGTIGLGSSGTTNVFTTGGACDECCGEFTCGTVPEEDCGVCADVPGGFTLVSSDIAMCPGCVQIPFIPFNYGDFTDVTPNSVANLSYDGACEWSGSHSTFPVGIYNNSDCTGHVGDLSPSRTVWYLYRTATLWIVEGHVFVTNAGLGGTFYGLIFYGVQPAGDEDCLGPAAAFVNDVAACGDLFAGSPLFDPGQPLDGNTDYRWVGVGGTVTIECWNP